MNFVLLEHNLYKTFNNIELCVNKALLNKFHDRPKYLC